MVREHWRDENGMQLLDAWNDAHPDALHLEYMKRKAGKRNATLVVNAPVAEKRGPGPGHIPVVYKQIAINLRVEKGMEYGDIQKYLALNHRISVTPAAIMYWVKNPPNVER